jgi:hypothetical protein
MEVGLEGNCRSYKGAMKGGDHNHEGQINEFLSSFNPKNLAGSSPAAPAGGSLCTVTENVLNYFFRFGPNVVSAPLATLLFAVLIKN